MSADFQSDRSQKRYTIHNINFLGAGVDASVYSATIDGKPEKQAGHSSKGKDRPVNNSKPKEIALKVVNANDKNGVDSIQREARVYKEIEAFHVAQSKRRHALANVCDLNDITTPILRKRLMPKLYDYGKGRWSDYSGDCYFLIMSLEKPMPWQQGYFSLFARTDDEIEWARWICIFAHQLVSRLQYVHMAGYAHCDTHDQNFCWTSRGRGRHDLLLIDFTIAKKFKDHLNDPKVSRSADLFRWSCALAGIAAEKSCKIHRQNSARKRDGRVKHLPNAILRDALTKNNAYIDGLGSNEEPDYNQLRSIWQSAYDKLTPPDAGRMVLFPKQSLV